MLYCSLVDYIMSLASQSGLRIRPFKVSGGSPRPPPEQTPVVKVSLSLSIYIYMYINR